MGNEETHRRHTVSIPNAAFLCSQDPPPARKLTWGTGTPTYIGDSLHRHEQLNHWPHDWTQCPRSFYSSQVRWTSPGSNPHVLITWLSSSYSSQVASPHLGHLRSISSGPVLREHHKSQMLPSLRQLQGLSFHLGTNFHPNSLQQAFTGTWLVVSSPRAIISSFFVKTLRARSRLVTSHFTSPHTQLIG